MIYPALVMGPCWQKWQTYAAELAYCCVEGSRTHFSGSAPCAGHNLCTEHLCTCESVQVHVLSDSQFWHGDSSHLAWLTICSMRVTLEKRLVASTWDEEQRNDGLGTTGKNRSETSHPVIGSLAKHLQEEWVGMFCRKQCTKDYQ